MAIYRTGSTITLGQQVGSKDVMPGQEYVFYYRVPKVAFAFLSGDSILSILKGWVSLKQKLSVEGGDFVAINGAQVNTDTGEMWIRASVNPPDKPQTIVIDGKTVELKGELKTAGVSPYAVFAAIGAVFAVVGLSATMIAVYRVAGGGSAPGSPVLDPCRNPGVINFIQCQIQRITLVSAGVVIGVVVVFGLLLYRGNLRTS